MKITGKQYAKFLYEISCGNKQEGDVMLGKIAKIIKKNGDEKKLKEIERSFKDIQKKEEGFLEVIVYSRKKLSDDFLKEIKANIAKRKGASEGKILLSSQVDDSIKGGLIIRVENEIIDATLNNKLRKLKRALT
jgi:F-type H+-transporting ATPase subunit delta